MKVLVDSSAWIDFFKSGESTFPINELIEENLICTCGLILAELIPFIALKNEKKLIDLMYSIDCLESIPDWLRIIKYQTTCLKKGLNNVGIPDLIILQTVIDNKVKLYTLDKHFTLIKKEIPFELMNI